jgi:hypothetical protein
MSRYQLVIALSRFTEYPAEASHGIGVLLLRLELWSKCDDSRDDLVDDLDIVLNLLRLVYEVAEHINGGVEQLIRAESFESSWE